MFYSFFMYGISDDTPNLVYYENFTIRITHWLPFARVIVSTRYDLHLETSVTLGKYFKLVKKR